MAIRKHVSKSGDVTYQARYRDERNRSRTKTFPTKRKAEKFLKQVDVDKARGVFADPSRRALKFSAIAEDWLMTKAHRKPSTRARYESILRLHLLPEFGETAIGRIDRRTVESYVLRLSEETAAGTVRKGHAVLHNVLAYAVKAGHLTANAASDIDTLPPATKTEMHFLTVEQVKALADEMEPPLDLLVRFAAVTGLRAGETHALQRKHVDLARSVVIVERSGSTHGDPSVDVGPTKTGRVRTVGLPTFMAEELRSHLRTRPIHPEALVFVMPQGEAGGEGTPIRHSNLVRRHFKPAVRRALPPALHGLRWHDLRHTAAALAIAQGAHPKAIQERLGHSSITLTFDTYGHLLPGLDQALTAGLDAAWRDNGPGDVVKRW